MKDLKEPIISVSGLRGVIGDSLTPDVAGRFACAFAAGLPPGALLVTRDSRTTGRMLADALRADLCAMGRDVIDAGIAATPTTGVLIRARGLVGGIQISASHNPAPYNGLKLFDSQGQVITADAGELVIQRYREGAISYVPHDRIGNVETAEDTSQGHCERILSIVNVPRIRERRFRVLLDSNSGAGSLLAAPLLSALGCECEILGSEPNGHFLHAPEPTAENLKQVCQEVVRHQAQVGFCQDPDADRLAIISEAGEYIGEEYTLALCLDHVLQQRKGAIVTNCSTSRMAEDLSQKYRVPFFRSRVGEANVVALMQQYKAVFGGEGNGGPIDPRVGFVRDSFVGMALILDAMAATGKTVTQLVAAIPRYAICKDKTTLPPTDVPAALAAVERHFAAAKPDRLDGLRLDWPNQWLLIRASNTEPIVRIVAEAPAENVARQLCDEALRVIETRK